MWQDGVMQDSAVFGLKTEILSGETQSFEHQVQMLPPTGKWTWKYHAVSVEAGEL
jgi:hypothetical protein